MVVRPYGCPNLWLSEWLSELREEVKYYFADFVRKGGGGVPPKSVTPFSPKILSVKGEGVYPQVSNLFLDKKTVFF